MLSNSLDELLLIYEFNSFSKAAEKLGITQPALSHKVKKIEDELGVKIFNRAPDVSPTSEGLILLNYINQSKLLDIDLKKELDSLSQGLQGTLTVGSSHGFTNGYLPAKLAIFHKKYPNIKLSLVDGGMEEIEQMALDGKLDLYITALPFEEKLFNKVTIFEENLFICAPPKFGTDAGLKKKIITKELLNSTPMGDNSHLPKISIELFENETFILLPEHLNLGKISFEVLRQSNIAISNYILTNQMTTALALTQYDVGITFATESYLRYAHFMNFPTLFMLDNKMLHRTVYAAYAHKRYLSYVARVFIDILKEGR